ncbi:MAG TPA: helix-turn-helix domain-containing protein [Prolixibacteraceae bacterium]|nr:helix-turn-helix domain-containing protein [Prolixibacteraceae bacterium]
MAEIKNEIQYQKSLERIEELLQVVGNETPKENKDFVELDILSDLVAEFEEKYYPIAKPSLASVIRLRMAEMGITQKGLAELLEVSPSRISEFLNGKSEPTLKVAKLLHQKLNIDPEIILA